jgi:branched-chain amino acid transport system ATP-binding protein
VTNSDKRHALLEALNLEVHYGGIAAVKGISFAVEQGEMVCLIGANGAGKTSTLKALARMIPCRGEIHYRQERLDRLPSHDLIRKGLALVPEGRGVFARLTVTENLAMGAYHRNDKPEIARDLEHIFTLLPRLKERATQVAGTLSGGEQQMLAIGRALMGGHNCCCSTNPPWASHR